MLGVGIYWAGGELLWLHLQGRPLKLMLLAGVFPAFLGGYLLWVDFIAPALRIKTGEGRDPLGLCRNPRSLKITASRFSNTPRIFMKAITDCETQCQRIVLINCL